MSLKFTNGSLKAAKVCQNHIKATGYSYSPEEAAVDIDSELKIPAIVSLIKELVEEAKRDLAASPTWTGSTVRVSRSRIKELSNLVQALSNE